MHSTEFCKMPLYFMTLLLSLSQYFTNCYFSFSLRGSPLNLLIYCTKLSIFSLFLPKPLPAWYCSQMWLSLPLLYGCSKPVASYSGLDRGHEADVWFSFWHLLVPAQPLIQHGQSSSFPSPSCLSHDGGNTILTHIQARRLGIVWVAARQIYIDHFKDSCVFLCTAARKCIVSHYTPYPKIAIPHPLSWSNFLMPALIV